MKPKSSNTQPHRASVTRQRRQRLNGHRSVVLWFTGLSGSGKSTLAHAVEEYLHQSDCRTLVLDGDNVRHGLCGDLGFSPDDRSENIRRIGEMTRLMLEAGVLALTAFISPYRRDRDFVRQLLPEGDFIEVFVDCPLSVCEQRDVKGLYKKARNGEIESYTGITSPYERPENPELVIDTNTMSLSESVEHVVHYLTAKGVIQNAG